GAMSASALRQREDVDGVAVQRMLHVRADGARDLPRAAAAEAGGYRDVFAAADAERHRVALHRRPEPRLPERLARPHVEGAEHAIEIADKADAAGGGQDRREERGPLLAA